MEAKCTGPPEVEAGHPRTAGGGGAGLRRQPVAPNPGSLSLWLLAELTPILQEGLKIQYGAPERGKAKAGLINFKSSSEERKQDTPGGQLKQVSSFLWTSGFKVWFRFVCSKPSHSSNSSEAFVKDRDS